jgi:hypothetical protein
LRFKRGTVTKNEDCRDGGDRDGATSTELHDKPPGLNIQSRLSGR